MLRMNCKSVSCSHLTSHHPRPPAQAVRVVLIQYPADPRARHQAQDPDGSEIEFQADLSGLEEITRWVLSWGSKAKVLGPPELVRRVAEEVDEVRKGRGERVTATEVGIATRDAEVAEQDRTAMCLHIIADEMQKPVLDAVRASVG